MSNLKLYTTEKIKELVYNKIDSDILINNIKKVFPTQEIKNLLSEINNLDEENLKKIKEIKEIEKKIKDNTIKNEEYSEFIKRQKALFDEIYPKLEKLKSFKEYSNKINDLLENEVIIEDSQGENAFKLNIFYNIKEDYVNSIGYAHPKYYEAINEQDYLIGQIFSKWGILKGKIYNPGAGSRFTHLFDPSNVEKLIVQDTSKDKLEAGKHNLSILHNNFEENKLEVINKDILEYTPNEKINCIVFSSILPIFRNKMQRNEISKEKYMEIMDKMLNNLDEKGVILESGDIQKNSFEDEYLKKKGFARIELPPFRELHYANTFNSIYIKKNYEPIAQEKINKMKEIFERAVPKKGPLSNINIKPQ